MCVGVKAANSQWRSHRLKICLLLNRLLRSKDTAWAFVLLDTEKCQNPTGLKKTVKFLFSKKNVFHFVDAVSRAAVCVCVFPCTVDSSELTHTLEVFSRCGEQQLALHAAGAGTAGDAGLLIAALHPVRQPEQAAVAVQRVGSDRTEGINRGKKKRRVCWERINSTIWEVLT